VAFSLNCRDEDYTDASVTFSYFDVTAAYVRKPRFARRDRPHCRAVLCLVRVAPYPPR
jgi:hypothetical protein